MDSIRIINLPSKTYIEEGDYIAIDNQQDGTQKVQFTNLFDSSLSQSDKIAPANTVGQQFTNTNTEIAALRAAVGSPLKASTVAQMTDTNKIYVYVGSESGYTNGNWYYWDGSAWTSGGVYNSVAVVTDPTLTLSGVPADAKATGDEVTNLKSALNLLGDDGFLINSYAWQKGGLDGIDITTQMYRAVTTDIHTVAKDTLLRITDSNYQYLVAWEVDGAVTATSWMPSTRVYKMKANVDFRVMIRKASENYVALTDSELAHIKNILVLSTNIHDALKDISAIKKMSMYGDGLFSSDDFVIGIHYASGTYYSDPARVTTAEKMSFPFETRIAVETGYRYAVIILDSQGAVVSDSGWLTDDYVIPANTDFYINIDNGNTSATADVETYVAQIAFRTPLALEVDSLKGVGSYSYEGVDIKPQQHGFNTNQLAWNYSSPTTQGTFTPQAMSYSNGVVFKGWKEDLIQLYNFADGTKIAEYAITCEHADCMDFSNEYYDSNDEFPLAYFTSDTNPLKVYVNRLTRSSGTLIRTLLFPIENAGYYAGHAVDATNNKIITLGYSENTFDTNPNGTNHMICCVWDLNNLTDNQDSTYTPDLLKTFTLPFMMTTQDQCYYNDKFFVISSDWQYPANTIIYVIDTALERIIATMDDIPYKDYETEGIFWVNDDMYVNGNGITKYIFV